MGTRSKRRRQNLTARPGAGGLLWDPRGREGPPRGTAPPRAPPGPSRALETGAQDLLLLFGPRRGRSEGRHGWCPPRGAGVRLSLLYFVIKTKANEVSPDFGSRRRPPAKRHLGEAQQPSGTAGQPGESPPLRVSGSFPPPRGGPSTFSNLLGGSWCFPRACPTPWGLLLPPRCHQNLLLHPGLGLSRRQDRAAGPPPPKKKRVSCSSGAQHPRCGSFLATEGGGPCPPATPSPLGPPMGAALGWCMTEAVAGGVRHGAGTR